MIGQWFFCLGFNLFAFFLAPEIMLGIMIGGLIIGSAIVYFALRFFFGAGIAKFFTIVTALVGVLWSIIIIGICGASIFIH